MASRLLGLSLVESLKNSIDLKSLSAFQTALNSIKRSNVPLDSTLKYIIEAYNLWNFIDEESITLMNSKIKESKVKELEMIIQYMTFSSMFDLSLLPYLLESLKEQTNFFHPLELNESQICKILESLDKARYYNWEILEFLNESILGSNLPLSRMSLEIAISYLKYYSNTGIRNSEIMDLVNWHLNIKAFKMLSLEKKVSVMHSMCLMDNFEINPEILSVFMQMRFDDLKPNQAYEAYLVFNYLETFKGVELSENAKKFRNKNVNDRIKNMIIKSAKSSVFQKNVEYGLKACNRSFEREHVIEINKYLFTVDIFIPPNFIYEAQGPLHYITPLNIEIANSRKKREYLEIHGYIVHPISHLNWPTKYSSQISYLNSILPK